MEHLREVKGDVGLEFIGEYIFKYYSNILQSSIDALASIIRR